MKEVYHGGGGLVATLSTAAARRRKAYQQRSQSDENGRDSDDGDGDTIVQAEKDEEQLRLFRLHHGCIDDDESRIQTTFLQHNLGPPDLPPLYQPQHRASV